VLSVASLDLVSTRRMPENRSMPQGREGATGTSAQPDLLPLNAVTSLASQAVGEGRLFSTFQNQLDALEEKFTRQLSGFQGQLARQSKRLVEAVLTPLEAKVSAIEGREGKIDCMLSDLSGSVKGLMEEVQLQVHRSDKADAKLRHWRKLLEDGYTRLEDDAQRRYDAFKQDLADLAAAVERCEAAAAGAAATATEVSTLAVTRSGLHDRSLLEPRAAMMSQTEIARLTEGLRMELGQASIRQELDTLGQCYKDLEAKVAVRGEVQVQENDMCALDLVAELRGVLQKALERTQDTVGKVDKLFDDAEEMGGHGMLVAMSSRLEKLEARSEERHRILEAEVHSVTSRSISAAPSSVSPARVWEEGIKDDLVQLNSRVLKLEMAKPRGELPESSLVGKPAPPPPTQTIPWQSTDRSLPMEGAMQAMQKKFDEELFKLKASVREQPPTGSAKEEMEPDLKAIWSTMSDIVDVVENSLPGPGLGTDAAAEGVVAVEAINSAAIEDAVTSDELQHELSKVWGTLGTMTELINADSLGAKLSSNGLYDMPTVARPSDSVVGKIVEDRTLSTVGTSIEDAVAMAAQSVQDANSRSVEVYDAVQELSNEVAVLQGMVSKVREGDVTEDAPKVAPYDYTVPS